VILVGPVSLDVYYHHYYYQLHNRVVGSLITLLESLGIVSITAAELRQLIQLLKPDQDNCQASEQTRGVTKMMSL